MKEKILEVIREDNENGLIEKETYNEEDLSGIRKQREAQNKILQEKYDECKDYTSKLKFIHSLLSITQGDYLKYKDNEFLSEEHLNVLIQKLGAKAELNDNIFFEFINEEIIKPINSGHVKLSPIKTNVIGEDLRKRSQNMVVASAGDDVIYIKIKSFSGKYLNKDKETFMKIEKYLEQHEIKNIIFDIRGNVGGTDEYFKYFNIFTNKEINILDRYKDLLTNKNYNIEYTGIPANLNAKEYNKYILVNDKVFSTAETLAMLCKSSGFAKVVGEETGGEGYGFTPFTLDILDTNTKYIKTEDDKTYNLEGVKLNFPIEAPINEKGEIDYDNYYSTTPDIICDPQLNEDALEIVLLQIRKQREEQRKKDVKLRDNFGR